MSYFFLTFACAAAIVSALTVFTPAGTEAALDAWSNNLFGLSKDAHGSLILIMVASAALAAIITWWESRRRKNPPSA